MSAAALVTDCRPDPARLGVLAECLNGPGGPDPEWPGQYLSTRTVAYSCGILARAGEPVVHAHDPGELQRCRQLAAEAAGLMQGIYLGWADESDHTLDPFFLPANAGDPVPGRLTEAVFRSAMRGTVYPGARLAVEPFEKTSPWWRTLAELPPDFRDDPQELARVARWQHLFDWFRSQPELHSPVHVGFEEPPGTEDFAAVYPKLFLALTRAGSIVGLASCVVWT